MKKIFTICLVGLMAFSAFGQRKAYRQDRTIEPVSFEQRAARNLSGEEVINMPYAASVSSKAVLAAPQENTIGYTTLDLQSNSAVDNRFFRYGSEYGEERYGKLAATWMGSKEPELSPNNDRGSHYNFFNGTEWLYDRDDVDRIESARSGWPTYVPLKDGGEMVISHLSNGSYSYKRDVLGEGAWEGPIAVAYDASDDYIWPRVCVNPQTGTIHLLTAAYNGKCIYYSRSMDGGVTWSPDRERVEQLINDDDGSYFSSDDYVWAESNGGVIAYSVVSQYQDIVIMKSDDDGETWNKTVVWQSPVPGFDGSSATASMLSNDTLYYPAGLHSIAIDDYGDCHIAFNVLNVVKREDGTLGYWPFLTFMMYWNEGLAPFFQANSYQALNPEMYDEYFDDGRLLLAQGFDFDGDAYTFPGESTASITSYRMGDIILTPQIAVAGPDRLLFALEVQDEKALYDDKFMFTRIFMCSYVFDGDNWVFDSDWIEDESMKFYDIYSPDVVEGNWRGWYRLLDSDLHPTTNCMYTQLVAQKTTDDTGNFYVLCIADNIPGMIGGWVDSFSGDANNPQWLEGEDPTFTENNVFVFAESVDFNGPTLPEVWHPEEGIANHKPAKEELVIYPNPATNMISINAVEATNCVIYNMTGQVVAKQQLTQGYNTINISTLKAGVYVVSAGNNNARLIVQ